MIAAELTNSSADFGQIGPMVNAVRCELQAPSFPGSLSRMPATGIGSGCKRSPATGSRC